MSTSTRFTLALPDSGIDAVELSQRESGDRRLVRRLRQFYLFLTLTPLLAYTLRHTAHSTPPSVISLDAPDIFNLAGFALGLTGVVGAGVLARRPVLLRILEPVLTVVITVAYLTMAAYLPADAYPSGETLATSVAMAVLLVRALWVPSHAWVTLVVGGFIVLCVFVFLFFNPAVSHEHIGPSFLHWTTWGVPTVAATVWATSSLRQLRKHERMARALGSYSLEAEVGTGGMGKVYLARHRLLKMPAAIKVLHSQDPVFERRFLREAQALSELAHPHTVRLFDFGITPDDQPYFVMEYVRGTDLQAWVDTRGPLSPPLACRMLAQVAGALGEAHDRGIVHGDIKPSNLFLLHDRDGPVLPHGCFVKVLDFGLARRVVTAGDRVKTSLSETVTGTPLYMAPEQIQNPDDITASTDIYALGCVLFFLVTGRPLVRATTVIAAISEHLTRPVEELLDEAPDLPAPVRRILTTCLAKQPRERWQSVYELLDALNRYVPVSAKAMATTMQSPQVSAVAR